jgi:hypothetical protein
MRYRLAVLLFLYVLMTVVTLDAQVKAQAPASVQPSAQGESKTPASVPEEPRPALGVPPGYRYEAHGRRDPFVNPIPKPTPSAVAAAKAEPARPPGLKGASVDDVNVSGVFISKSEPSMTRAILQVPGMRAPVIASRGDLLFDAVIKEIRPDSVIFTKASAVSKPGNPSEGGEVTKKLRSTAGDKK